jgi:SOS response regulatory protein OraA/RecX
MSDKLVLLVIINGFKAGKNIASIRAELKESGVSDGLIDQGFQKYLDEFNQDNTDDALVSKNRKFEEWYDGAALTAYAMVQFTQMSDQERSKIQSALLRCCELDTFAMVMI